jgi:hypothetical protein
MRVSQKWLLYEDVKQLELLKPIAMDAIAAHARFYWAAGIFTPQ